MVDKKTIKETTYNKLNTKVNISKNKIPDRTTFISINQYDKYKQNLERKI